MLENSAWGRHTRTRASINLSQTHRPKTLTCRTLGQHHTIVYVAMSSFTLMIGAWRIAIGRWRHEWRSERARMGPDPPPNGREGNLIHIGSVMCHARNNAFSGRCGSRRPTVKRTCKIHFQHKRFWILSIRSSLTTCHFLHSALEIPRLTSLNALLHCTVAMRFSASYTVGRSMLPDATYRRGQLSALLTLAR